MGIDGADPSTRPGEPEPSRTFPPPKSPSPATVLVLIVGVVAVAGFGYGLWVAANSGHAGGSEPHFGVLFSRSPDGLTWNLTFTEVPSSDTPTNTYLSLATASAGTLIPATPLASLTGGEVPLTNAPGALFLLYHGQFSGSLSPGDFVSIGTTVSGSGASTNGWTAELTVNGAIFWQHVLQ